ncbi:hypothetical protein PUN28_007530 [Cardiocondyla obscurior]|uniref:Uncharacterized protein n=1 Tax=Cardiocondyla obscurior TaxID=286306 RepID=A0AAW2GA18_9HYME
MEDVEHYINIVQQKTLANQHKLAHIDKEINEFQLLVKESEDLRRKREQYIENIAKHLRTITSYKHSIHKCVHSTNVISGLPVPHHYASDVTVMFTDMIKFLNKVGVIYKALINNESNTDSLTLIHSLKKCVEAIASNLYQTKCSITQLEALKENIIALKQMLDSFDNAEGNV